MVDAADMHRSSLLYLSVCAAALSLGEAPAQNPTANEVFAETLHEVRAVRGLAIGKNVEFETLTKNELAKLHARANPSFAEDAAIFAKLGVLNPRLDSNKKLGDILARMMSVRYDAKTSTISVSAEARKLGRFVAKLLGAYGVGLATDIERYSIDARMQKTKTFDERFVLTALTEGAAMTTMNKWAIQHREGWTVPERLGLQKWELARNETSLRAPRIFSVQMAAGLVGRYFFGQGKGGTALLPQISSGTTQRIEQVWKDVPRSAEQVLHPSKYWTKSARSRDEPVVLMGEETLTTKLAELAGADLTMRNSLGEFGCAIVTSPLVQRIDAKGLAKLVGKPSYWSSRASQGWGGDKILVFGAGEEESLVWITVWDSDKDAREFAGRFGQLTGKRIGIQSTVAGRVAVFARGVLATKTAKIAGLVFEHAKAKKGGKDYALRGAPAAAPK